MSEGGVSALHPSCLALLPALPPPACLVCAAGLPRWCPRCCPAWTGAALRCRRLNTGDRLRNSFGGGQANQLARAVSSYQRRFGIPDTPHEAVAASLGGDT